MSEAMELFNYENQPIRTIEQDGDSWFVARDVCDVLELENTTRALDSLDEEDLTLLKVKSGGQIREMKLVNEPGLYQLVLKSRTPAAKAFKRWITHDLLPTLRKQGHYELPGRATTDDVCMPLRRYLMLKGIPEVPRYNSLCMRASLWTRSMGLKVAHNGHTRETYYPLSALDAVVPKFLKEQEAQPEPPMAEET